MIELYYWEGDPEAEELMDDLKSKGMEFQARMLDPEVPSGSPSVEYEGKLYTFDEFREKVGL